MRITLTLAAIALLSACSTASQPPVASTIQTQCLPLATFTEAESQELAIELAQLKALNLPMVTKVVLDDADMRAADRACLAH